MKLPLAELSDRYSIEIRKSYYGHGNDALLGDLVFEIRTSCVRLFNVDEATAMKIAATICGTAIISVRNADLANSEWQVRQGHVLPLDEIGRRAILTRKLNDARSQAKQEMSRVLHENVETRHFGFTDELGPITMDVQEPKPDTRFVHDSAAIQGPRGTHRG